jgi:hypothetical protein
VKPKYPSSVTLTIIFRTLVSERLNKLQSGFARAWAWAWASKSDHKRDHILPPRCPAFPHSDLSFVFGLGVGTTLHASFDILAHDDIYQGCFAGGERAL